MNKYVFIAIALAGSWPVLASVNQGPITVSVNMNITGIGRVVSITLDPDTRRITYHTSSGYSYTPAEPMDSFEFSNMYDAAAGQQGFTRQQINPD